MDEHGRRPDQSSWYVTAALFLLLRVAGLANRVRPGQKHFDDTVSGLSYDIFSNSCQILVYQILESFDPGAFHTKTITGVAFFLTRFTAGPVMLLTHLYLQRRGCDRELISEFCQMQYLFGFFLWARLFISINDFRGVLSPLVDFRTGISLSQLCVCGYLLICWVPVYSWLAFMEYPAISRRVDGRWYISKRFVLENGGSKTSNPGPHHAPLPWRLLVGAIVVPVYVVYVAVLSIVRMVQPMFAPSPE